MKKQWISVNIIYVWDSQVHPATKNKTKSQILIEPTNLISHAVSWKSMGSGHPPNKYGLLTELLTPHHLFYTLR